MKDPLQPKKNKLDRSQEGLLKDYQRPSADLIHESVMRGGGEAFLEPYEIGVPTLTERVAKVFSQFGHFGFEWLEKRVKPKNKRNKFTKYGSSQFRGEYDPEVVEKIKNAIEDYEIRMEEEKIKKKSSWWPF